MMTTLVEDGAPVDAVCDAVVVGGGAAGYTAALYLARADLAPVVVEGVTWGGLLQETTVVENFPGFPGGVDGPTLVANIREQAGDFGARFVTDDVTAITLADTDDGLHQVHVGDIAVLARTVVLAMGAVHRHLGVPGERALAGRGVSFCATCDATFFRGQRTCVIGGGDTAMAEALFLARFASEVTIVHRREEFRASPVMLQRARAAGNISWRTPFAVQEFLADEAGGLAGVRLTDVRDGAPLDLPVTGAFLAIGHVPQSELVAGALATGPAGHVLVEGRSTRTGRPGVFAAGDLVDHTYRQAITAAGSGCQAALDAQRYLESRPAATLVAA
jgi:thioredoxin reductase (NADPH)